MGEQGRTTQTLLCPLVLKLCIIHNRHIKEQNDYKRGKFGSKGKNFLLYIVSSFECQN